MLYGFDIGGTKIEFAVFNQKLEKRYSERIATPQDSYQSWLDAIVNLVKKADLQFHCTGSVGIGIPGFVHPDTGIAEIANIKVANQQPIISDLTRLLEREIRVENDANCFALSEAWDEDYKTANSVLGLILGTGFGGGIILNGKVYSGQTGMAGELGHMQLNYHALKLLGWDKAPIFSCGCGNQACLDTYLSGRGFELLYQHFYAEKKDAKTIIKHFYQNNPQAIEFVNLFIELMAISIGNIITAFDPEVIVLGGGLSNFDHLYTALPQALPAHLLRNTQVPLIRSAKYGDSGGVRGAAALFLSR
ncbi:N-acetylglucosamine kinase [Mergibacter septicus]|uniref:N-acetylglucosamine kinase n=1 Tax=Mergibacter septicus TaxID=221402 RepID=UPI00117948D1|nr:N-acetylglucosamine kinase [Mergibacter septicus]AWX13265.1 N-acetylglucosamine kinase [Mergibacter septicus]